MLWAPEEAGIGPFGSGGERNSLTPDPSAPSGPRSYSPAGWPYLLKGRGGREHAVLSQPLPVTAAPSQAPGGQASCLSWPAWTQARGNRSRGLLKGCSLP